MNSSKSQIVAQLWMYSCDAPDTNETDQEIERLAKLIDDVFSEQEVKWKVVNNSLSWRIPSIVCNLLGKLSSSEVTKLIGKDQARILNDWYFKNRSKYK